MTNLTTLQQQPIDDQIREVSRLVWEEQGNNSCDKPESPYDAQQTEGTDNCVNCGKTLDTHKPIPDITDPAVFWPLLWEIGTRKDRDFWFSCGFHADREQFYVDVLLTPDTQPREFCYHHKIPGLAVGYAYLKIKEQENVARNS